MKENRSTRFFCISLLVNAVQRCVIHDGSDVRSGDEEMRAVFRVGMKRSIWSRAYTDVRGCHITAKPRQTTTRMPRVRHCQPITQRQTAGRHRWSYWWPPLPCLCLLSVISIITWQHQCRQELTHLDGGKNMLPHSRQLLAWPPVSVYPVHPRWRELFCMTRGFS